MLQSRFFSNSTDRPRASTVEVLSVAGPRASSGTLEAVQTQHCLTRAGGVGLSAVERDLSFWLRAMAPLQRPVIEAELQSAQILNPPLVAEEKVAPKPTVEISTKELAGIVFFLNSATASQTSRNRPRSCRRKTVPPASAGDRRRRGEHLRHPTQQLGRALEFSPKPAQVLIELLRKSQELSLPRTRVRGRNMA